MRRRHACPGEEREGEERADHGSGMVRRAVEAERPAADRGIDRVGDQGVPRRSPDPLPHPVHHADRQHLGGGLREADQRPDEGGDPVAGQDQGLAPRHAVRQPAAPQPEERRGRLRSPLDRSHGHGARSEDGREEERQERIGHLGRHVGEQAHHGESQDVAAETGLHARTRNHPVRLIRSRRAGSTSW